MKNKLWLATIMCLVILATATTAEAAIPYDFRVYGTVTIFGTPYDGNQNVDIDAKVNGILVGEFTGQLNSGEYVIGIDKALVNTGDIIEFYVYGFKADETYVVMDGSEGVVFVNLHVTLPQIEVFSPWTSAPVTDVAGASRTFYVRILNDSAANVYWYLDGVQVSELAGPITLTAAVGTHTLTVTVTNIDNQKSASQTWTWVVSPRTGNAIIGECLFATTPAALTANYTVNGVDSGIFPIPTGCSNILVSTIETTPNYDVGFYVNGTPAGSLTLPFVPGDAWAFIGLTHNPEPTVYNVAGETRTFNVYSAAFDGATWSVDGNPVQTNGSATGSVSYIATATEGTHTVSVTATETHSSGMQVSGTLTWTWIVTAPPTTETRITGTVFNDKDRDGIQDPGELGLPNVKVKIELEGDEDGAEGDAEIEVVTDAEGHYSIVLAPGTYEVSAEKKGWKSVHEEVTITLGEGETKVADFGMWEKKENGGNTEIPEYPHIAYPMAAALGLMFLVSRRR